MADLKPCPFCGSAARLSRIISIEGDRRGERPSWDVDCTGTGCGVWRRFDAEADAVEAWNTRAALASSTPESSARPCTCHPDDEPPVPCAGRFALTECREAEPVAFLIEREGPGYGKARRAILLSEYDPRDPGFWEAGKQPDSYTVTPLYAPATPAEARSVSAPNTFEVGKPAPYFCPACQAVPRAGYCKLAGCPTAAPSSEQAEGGR